MDAQKGKDRFLALDSWRGIAAIGVAMTHFHIISVSHIADHPVIENITLFVDFFFVLSGFVISFAYWDRLENWTELKLFALRRFARLWPLHVATLIPLVALNLFWLAKGHPAFQPPDSWQTLAGNLFLIQGLGFFPPYSWNGQSWSISVEFWTYFVFATLCLWLPRRYAGAVAAIVLGLVAIKLLAFSRLFAEPMGGQLFFRCLYGFFSGQCVYFLWRVLPFRATSHQATAAEMASVLSVIGLLVYLPIDTPWFLLHALVFGALVWVFAAEAGSISRLLLKPLPRLLGRLSYSLYMVHMLVLALLGSPLRHWAQPLAHDKLAGDVLLLLFLVLTVALSSVTFQAIEKPGTRLFGPRRAPHLPG